MNKLCCNIGNFFLMNVKSVLCVFHSSSLLSGQFTHSLPHQMVPSLYHTLSSVLVSPLQSVLVSVSEWHLNFASLIVIFSNCQHITVCVCTNYISSINYWYIFLKEGIGLKSLTVQDVYIHRPARGNKASRPHAACMYVHAWRLGWSVEMGTTSAV